ncbi:MAG TPA: FAD-dependent oxidoreductase [Edaphocola sp.]|nr:FAD-dependent oxidoreductase [Edaphocola sp.]
MQQTDFLIIGQGIAGILTAFVLMQKGKSVMVMDKDTPGNASNMAGALLNPVNLNTGKIFPGQQRDFDRALKAYYDLEVFLKVSFLEKCPLFAFSDVLTTNDQLRACSQEQLAELGHYFHDPERACYIEKAYHIRFSVLKAAWKTKLTGNGQWRTGRFDYAGLKINPYHFQYQDIIARNIVFCEGAAGRYNPFFPNLPFTKNLGNILHVNIAGLNQHAGYHIDNKKLIPLCRHTFWMGSNYVWDFERPEPDPAWRDEQIDFLRKKLRLPFRVVSHFVAERPTTAGQQPLIRAHQEINNLYFFNGLGTRGFSKGAVWIGDLMELLKL